MTLAEALDRPVVVYAIMISMSLVAAVICFQVGGSVAKVTQNDATWIGFTFEAGGALAGFVIVFLLSSRVLDRINAARPAERQLIREYLIRLQGVGDPRGVRLRYSLFDTEAGDWGEWKEASYTLEPGALKVHVHEMQPRHVIKLRAEDGQQAVWESENDHAYGVSSIYLRPTMDRP